MFLSQQTNEGLKISVYSHVEATKLLLGNGFEYALTERFVWRTVLDIRGLKRHRSDNPSAYEFVEYNDLIQ